MQRYVSNDVCGPKHTQNKKLYKTETLDLSPISKIYYKDLYGYFLLNQFHTSGNISYFF